MSEKRDWLPPHTRLVLASEDILDQWGTRTEQGERITVEWGNQKPQGWYEPMFTRHGDDVLAPDVDRLATALSIVMSDMDKTPGPSGSYVLGEGTSYWRDRADAVVEHYAKRTRYEDIKE